jgi:hypothetical protein
MPKEKANRPNVRKNIGENSKNSKPISPQNSVATLLEDPRVLEYLRSLMEGKPQEAPAQTESWFDWALGLAKEVGPALLEMAPALLALL